MSITFDTTGARRRALLAFTVIPGSLLAVGIAATQFVAYKLHYDPALGAPVIGHVYWPWRWLQWWNAPWETQVDTVFQYVNMGLFALLAIVTLIMSGAVGRKRPKKHEGVHGTAKFAAEKEVRSSGLLPRKPGEPKSGVYIGAWTSKDGTLEYLTHDGPEHVMGIGPTRSGKTLGLVLPTLLTWPASAVIYDTKGELWLKTAGWRKAEANNVVLRWSPADLENTISWNPLDQVRIGTDYEYRDVANIIGMIADPKGSGATDHWVETATDLLIGTTLHVLHKRKSAGSTAGLSDSLHAISDPSKTDDTALYREMVSSNQVQVARIGSKMLKTEVRERSGIVSTAHRLLRLFHDPILARNTSRSDFLIDDLMNLPRPVSLYIETRGEDELRLRPIVRLFLTMMVARLISHPPKIVNGKEVSPHTHRLLMQIDEFATLGQMEPMEIGLSKMAGAGIKAYLLVQDREQIIKAYGQHETITSHCHIKTSYAPTNSDTAQWISDLCGETTIVLDDITESGGRGSSRGYSRSYHFVPRPLMTKDEVMRMKAPEKDGEGKIVSPGNVLISMAGANPIMGTQSLYFRDPEFVRRASIPAPPTMAIKRVA